MKKGKAFKDDQYILTTQVKQCFYLEDMARRQPHWKVVEHVNHKKISKGGVIVVEEDPDVIHFDNSSDLPLSTNLNDLDNTTLLIDGQSTEVDAPPDIIDLDEDGDIIDDKDALPHDLADSDDEDLVNVDDDDDGVDVMSADVARSHGGDGGGDDRKGTRKYNLGGRKAGKLHTRQETQNLKLKKITDDKGSVPIRFEWDDKNTLMPLGVHASHWSNYLGELIREMPLYYPSWKKVSAERKAAIVTKIGTQFNLKPHMQSRRWTDINAGIQQHLQKLYNTNKASLKAVYWVINPEIGTSQRCAEINGSSTASPKAVTIPTRLLSGNTSALGYKTPRPGKLIIIDVEKTISTRTVPRAIPPPRTAPRHIGMPHIAFWNDPRNHARPTNRQNPANTPSIAGRDPDPTLLASKRWQ
ncbi:hypothetical protein Tco_0882101 [Tanacetum coccineum]